LVYFNFWKVKKERKEEMKNKIIDDFRHQYWAFSPSLKRERETKIRTTTAMKRSNRNRLLRPGQYDAATVVFLILMLMVGISTGCTKKTTIESPPGQGIRIETPKTKTQIGGGQGVHLETPKTEVQIGGGKGIQVDAPETKVQIGDQASP
jgi:hypothetical protein